jgi:hypothetical protein
MIRHKPRQLIALGQTKRLRYQLFKSSFQAKVPQHFRAKTQIQAAQPNQNQKDVYCLPEHKYSSLSEGFVSKNIYLPSNENNWRESQISRQHRLKYGIKIIVIRTKSKMSRNLQRRNNFGTCTSMVEIDKC